MVREVNELKVRFIYLGIIYGQGGFNWMVDEIKVQNIEWNPVIEKLFYPLESYGGAYQLKVEPRGDILTLLSGLAELSEKLEMLDFESNVKQELSYVM